MSSGSISTKDSQDDAPDEEGVDEKSEIVQHILALFMSDDAAPIRGRIMLVKETFLLVKEIVPELSETVRFFPYQWGPYSNDVAKAVNWLIDNGHVETTKENRETVYSLTPEGRNFAQKATRAIEEDVLENIAKMKRTTHEIGLTRLLRFIYSQYPQYATHSRGKAVYADR